MSNEDPAATARKEESVTTDLAPPLEQYDGTGTDVVGRVQDVSRYVRRVEWRTMGLILLALVAVPFVFADLSYLTHVLIIAFIYALLAMSWDVIMGFAGQLSVGHVAFFALGAYGSAILADTYSWSPWLSLLAAVGMSAVFGLAVGWLCLRFRGPYVLMVTLALVEIFRLVTLTFRDFTGGSRGIIGIPNLEGFTTLRSHYFLGLGLVTVGTVFLGAGSQSRLGKRLRAVREDPEKAEMTGINTTRYRIGAFVLSAAMAGLAGSFFAHYIGILSTAVFGLFYLVYPIGMVIIGGAGTVFGAVTGTLILVTLIEMLRATDAVWSNMLLGGALVLVMLLVPEGTWPQFRRFFERRGHRKLRAKMEEA